MVLGIAPACMQLKTDVKGLEQHAMSMQGQQDAVADGRQGRHRLVGAHASAGEGLTSGWQVLGQVISPGSCKLHELVICDVGDALCCWVPASIWAEPQAGSGRGAVRVWSLEGVLSPLCQRQAFTCCPTWCWQGFCL